MKALIEDFACAEASDAQLALSAREGSTIAFEALFRRYRARVSAFVRSSIPDDGRVEDVVQEVFISALRNLDSLENPEVFGPWLHRIARNACVDHLRRLSREEISIDSARLDVAEGRHLRPPQPSVHASVSSKQEIDHLREAFGELPAAQHDALLLREFEGLSYDEIGRRLRLSRPAVESVLFRARRGLKGEFAEISTGERCRHVRSAMALSAEAVGMGREHRLVVRHMRSCTNCRREAVALGLVDLALEAGRGGPLRRAASKAAAVFPLPFIFARRGADVGAAGGANGAGTSAGFSAQAQAALVQLGSAGHVGVEQASSMAQKAVAVIATVAVVGGGGVAAVRHSGITVSLPKISAKAGPAEQTFKARPDGLPQDAEEASEVLFGAPTPAGASKPGGVSRADALVVPPALINVSPTVPSATGQPPAPPETASGQPAAASDPPSGAPAPATAPESSPAVQHPAVTSPPPVQITPVKPGNGNQKPRKSNGRNGGDTDSGGAAPTPADPQSPITAPGSSDPAAAPDAVSLPPVSSDPIPETATPVISPGRAKHGKGLPPGLAKKL